MPIATPLLLHFPAQSNPIHHAILLLLISPMEEKDNKKKNPNPTSTSKKKDPRKLMMITQGPSLRASRIVSLGLQAEELKLAALAISFNVRLRSAYVSFSMQERAIRLTRTLLDSGAGGRRRPNPSVVARSLKKEFDSAYGPAWHCVAGKSFGSFVTHSPGGFLYFSADSLFVLLFKTEVHVVSR